MTVSSSAILSELQPEKMMLGEDFLHGELTRPDRLRWIVVFAVTRDVPSSTLGTSINVTLIGVRLSEARAAIGT